LGRRIKKPSLSNSFYKILKSVGSFRTKTPLLPREELTLQCIIQGLLMRIELRDKEEFRMLEGFVREAAITERLYPDWTTVVKSQYMSPNTTTEEDRKEVKELLADMILTLATAKVSRAKHSKDIIKLQRDLLAHYLDQKKHHFNSKTRNPAALRSLWVQEHQSPLLDLLSSAPCNHPYPADLDRRLNENAGNCKSPADFMLLILSEIHHTTRQYISKILSH